MHEPGGYQADSISSMVTVRTEFLAGTFEKGLCTQLNFLAIQAWSSEFRVLEAELKAQYRYQGQSFSMLQWP
jgi:hypothetical protein